MPTPPPLAAWLLRRLLPSDVRYAALGDFAEQFAALAEAKGLAAARRWYWTEVGRSVPSLFHNHAFWRGYMLRNYLRVAFRTMRRQPVFAAINVFGMALGLAAALLIAHYLVREQAYDRHHQHADHIYRVATERQFPDQSVRTALSPRPLAAALQQAAPEVAAATRLSNDRTEQVLVRHGTQQFYETDFRFADPNVFEVFDLPLVQGSSATALAEPRTVILTEPAARKYFGNTDPLGQVLTIRLRGDGDTFDYRVTGIAEAPPPTSHFQFDFLAHYPSHPFMNPQRADNWRGLAAYTYVRLHPSASADSLTARLPVLTETRLGAQLEAGGNTTMAAFQAAGNGFRFFLQPLRDIHLHSALANELGANGSAAYVRFFGLLAVFILVLAGVNFVNLSTAQGAARAREVGVRKALGSARRQLVHQFLTESVVVSFLALGGALLLALAALPLLGWLTGTPVAAAALLGPRVLLGMLALALGLGVLAGAYPAFILSRYQPTEVFRGGRAEQGRGAWLRSGLVVFQFAIAMGLMLATAVVYEQLAFARTADPGFNPEQTLVLDGTEVLRSQTAAFQSALLALPAVQAAAHTEAVPGQRVEASPFRARPEAEPQQLDRIYTGFGLGETLGLRLAAGRFPDPMLASDSMAAVLNETAVANLGLSDPIGQPLTRTDNGRTYTIVGVVEDFHTASFHAAIGPTVLLGPDPFYENRPRQRFVVRLQADELPATLAALQATWARFIPQQPMDAHFLDTAFAAQYRSERTLARLFGLFTLLALVIAGLGLFGLAMFTARRRQQELGVRKVFGASTWQLAWLLTHRFVRPVALAFVLVAPLAYVLLTRWLGGFAYHITPRLGTFLLIGCTAFFIAALTVSYQALSAARKNPAETLRQA